ncbi:uncharacterized protein A4U43_UnF5850 [Asparagus officinalis]|uniref:Uncharacterized protein n=1 Tax=Asparagus officinalis TaxID=4686 RepID=A0A1R3L6K5_ASPOF|nr:uncharacterized protein A4U43_UnF5850 [Asparagus officinalis]
MLQKLSGPVLIFGSRKMKSDNGPEDDVDDVAPRPGEGEDDAEDGGALDWRESELEGALLFSEGGGAKAAGGEELDGFEDEGGGGDSQRGGRSGGGSDQSSRGDSLVRGGSVDGRARQGR